MTPPTTGPSPDVAAPADVAGPGDLADPATDPSAVAARAAAVLAERTGAARHDVALVLGSGWQATADLVGTTVAQVPVTDLPGFPPPAALGHVGVVRSVEVPGAGGGAHRALVFASRTHLYEGRGVRPVVHAVRTAAAAGCSTIVLTNGCGGLDPSWGPGTPVLVSDHINLTATSPLEGATFVDLTDLYSARLRALAREVDPSLPEGVYVQFRGPHYETPAEVAMAGRMGGHLVGMSTTLEAIAARQAGMEVLGISLVTNLAAGVGDRPLDAQEVVDAGRAAGPRIGALLADVVRRVLAAGPA
ncbi:purine-nucleoside phosphorylase [Quadrisphaera sp. DSM 44207]|uniref:purine-nucleoside phosphorylase n=1 Tax=Quadrisphaera sp. DSM 44207 TaxID=1881057 RepID=UPI0008811D30|nr:purine-nucleoside phosphorylase [Quadrisphaera sp. DSM 44207]SDQ11609.1 purine-nucleoside phosphorylase [Quadrisphaera sp. DSM 44207]